jgi:hypothetical protein
MKHISENFGPTPSVFLDDEAKKQRVTEDQAPIVRWASGSFLLESTNSFFQSFLFVISKYIRN